MSIKTLLVFFVFTSCIQESAITPDNLLVDELNGEWNMDSYSAFIPDLPVINKGEVVWSFDAARHTVLVQNDVYDKYPYLLKPGTYVYSESNDLVTIEGQNYKFSIDNESLILDSNTNPMLASDAPVITFSKK